MAASRGRQAACHAFPCPTPRVPAVSVPDPSREAILDFIEEERAAGREVGRREIAKAFGLDGGGKIWLKRLLKEMAEDGEIGGDGQERPVHPRGALPPVLLSEIKRRDREGDLVAQPLEWDEAENGASNDGEDACCHRISGWPTPVQGDMQTECALVAAGHYCGSGQSYQDPALQSVRDSAGDWLLLLQLGTDEKLGMNWGDDGQLYIWIRREDLRARRFDQARLVLQCH